MERGERDSAAKKQIGMHKAVQITTNRNAKAETYVNFAIWRFWLGDMLGKSSL
ncbi:hypothetical protein [Paraburkholderia caffeinilytica]|uniref:hypothetical protein n=1 Tax=Paraburkholderia caffeinilytica TaxID=1761016 RepID=UPI0038BCBABE